MPIIVSVGSLMIFPPLREHINAKKYFIKGPYIDGAWGWQPHHLHVPNIMEIWEPKIPGTLWATPGLLRDSFNFYLTLKWQHEIHYGELSLLLVIGLSRLCLDLVGWVSFANKTKYQVPNAWYSVKQILLVNDCRFCHRKFWDKADSYIYWQSLE